MKKNPKSQSVKSACEGGECKHCKVWLPYIGFIFLIFFFLGIWTYLKDQPGSITQANNLLWLLLALAIFVVLGVIGYYYSSKIQQEQCHPDYRGIFILGVCFLPLGYFIDNHVFTILGAAYLLTGLIHRDKWGKHRRWKDFTPGEKRVKIWGIGILSLLVALTGILLYMQGI